MQRLRARIEPLAPFGTPLAGDTLFGQLCWAARERLGEAELVSLLDGYTGGAPFLVVSDGFPASWVPRPALPDFMLGEAGANRKEMKRRQWLPIAGMHLPLKEWLAGAAALQSGHGEVTTQNTINRFTGTTGTGPFAPRQVHRLELRHGNPHAQNEGFLDVYLLHDEARLATRDLGTLLSDIGNLGFGRDASTGLGKFRLVALEPLDWDGRKAQHALTLASCAPEPSRLDAARCFYQPLTRFGRHGNLAALGANPFKRPVLLLRTGALLRFVECGVPELHGRGLGGPLAPLSAAMPATVHQGYAPLLPLVVGEPA